MIVIILNRLEWGLRYTVLMDRYSNIIRGVFSAHTHEDSFQVVKSKITNDLAGIIQVLPALSTFPNLNPSFRVYTVDKATSTLLDYEQYRLVLSEQNDKATEAKWNLAYKFTEFYEVPDMDYSHYPKFVDRMQTDEAFFRKFIDHLWAGGPRGPNFITKYDEALQFITCRLLTSDMYATLDCIGTNYVSLEFFFGYGFLANFVNPKWGYALRE